MKILIYGPSGCGKDTFCEWLNQWYGITYISSSHYAADEFLIDKINNEFNDIGDYKIKDVKDLERVKRDYDKVNDQRLRNFMFEAIEEYNDPWDRMASLWHWARAQGFERVYTATFNARGIVERLGWKLEKSSGSCREILLKRSIRICDRFMMHSTI